MAEVVYILCALTSLLCAVMLYRRFRQVRTNLLFWSCACFVCFTLNNILLFVDLVLIPASMDLSVARNIVNLSGLLMLLYGLIWETV
jgi:hypothetical protein